MIIIGGGPAGAALGSYLAKEQIRTLLIEKEKFPRFRIGESLLPYSMEVFDDLGFSEVLNESSYLKKYGALFIRGDKKEQHYFDFTQNGKAKYPFAYEVERSSFDQLLLEHAISLGLKVNQPEEFLDCEFFDSYAEVKTNKANYKAKYVIDTSGLNSRLGKQVTDKKINPDFTNNIALYSHFEGVLNNLTKHKGDITIGLLEDKIWSWNIPIGKNKTSVGVVYSKKHQFKGSAESIFENILEKNDLLKDQLKNSQRLLEFKKIGNYSFTSQKIVGKRWALIGDSACFLDPVFSSGVHVGLCSAKFLSEKIMYCIDHDYLNLDSTQGLDYQKVVFKGAKRFHSLLNIFYEGDIFNRVQQLDNRPLLLSAMTNLVAGGVWDDSNPLFRFGNL